jgi:hypothetical protein
MLVPKSVFAARKICDREQSRYALGGMEFSRDKAGAALACATDGRRLVALTWQEPDAAEYPAPPNLTAGRRDGAQPFILPYAACDQASKVKLGAKCKPILQHVVLQEPAEGENDITIFATDLENRHQNTARKMDGRFPRWPDCIPNYATDSISIDVDAKFLAECAETLAAHMANSGATNDRAVTLTIRRPVADEKHHHLAPVLLSAAAPDGRKALAVIMPLGRGNDDEAPRPRWDFHAKPAPAPEPAAAVDQPPEEPSDLEAEPQAGIDTDIEPAPVPTAAQIVAASPVVVEPSPAEEPAASSPAAPAKPRRRKSARVAPVAAPEAEPAAEPAPEPVIVAELAEPEPHRPELTEEPAADGWRAAARRIAAMAFV